MLGPGNLALGTGIGTIRNSAIPRSIKQLGLAAPPCRALVKFEMTWKPTDDIDEQVRSWMRARRWEVTATDYHFEQEIYSWRHQQPGRKSLYGLRHSHASLLLAAGEHPKVVQERLGHASIQLTLDTYSHVVEGLQERASERLEALLTKSAGIAQA